MRVTLFIVLALIAPIGFCIVQKGPFRICLPTRNGRGGLHDGLKRTSEGE